MYAYPLTRVRQRCMSEAVCAGICRSKQRYTSCPLKRPGFDRVTVAWDLMRLPLAWSGTPLLALLMPVARATRVPHPRQCSFSTYQEPSANSTIARGRMTRRLPDGIWLLGTLIADATVAQKEIGCGSLALTAGIIGTISFASSAGVARLNSKDLLTPNPPGRRGLKLTETLTVRWWACRSWRLPHAVSRILNGTVPRCRTTACPVASLFTSGLSSGSSSAQSTSIRPRCSAQYDVR